MEPNRQKRAPKGDIKYAVSLNEEQKEARRIIEESDVVLLTGAAGSGKSLLGAMVGLDSLFKKQTAQLILTRPVVPAGDDIGFLKGGLESKMEPWMAGIVGNLTTLRPKVEINKLLDSGDIEIVPMAYMRSRTFLDAVVIVEEVQNITKRQLELILGRMGKGSKLIFTGDVQQVDLKNQRDTCLPLFYKMAESIPTLNVIELKTNHRHPIVPQMLELLASA